MSTFFPTGQPTPITFLPQRAIGPFTATVTIEEAATDELEITQHPVQQGAAITDHAFLKPASLAIKVAFNDADAPLAETYANLLALQASRTPFTVVTGKRQYTNMLLKSLGQTTDRTTETILSISAQLQEVLLVPVTITTVPPRSKQRQPGKTGSTENAGTKKAQPADTKKVSALQALLGS